MGSVIVGGARTPIGKLLGAFTDLTATDLGGVAIAGALQRSGVRGDQVDYVVMGHVLQAGTGQISARQAAVKGGVPMTVPALTVNKVCLSGLNAIALADQLIRAGECEVVVAGGMESMTAAPHLLPKSRSGYKYGDVALVDSMSVDGLWDVFTDQAMGSLTDSANVGSLVTTRAAQDGFAARSHQRAEAAVASGVMREEIVEVTVPQRRGQDLVVSADEGIRSGVTAESLSKLRPAFGPDGTITAGSASPISDGAAAVVVMSREMAERLGCDVLAEIVAHGQVAGPDSSLQAAAGSRDRSGVQAGGSQCRRPRPDRDQRGIRGGRYRQRPGLGPDRRADRRTGQRQRRRDRPRPPDRRLRCPLGPAPGPGAPTTRRGVGVAALCGGGGQGDALILKVPTDSAHPPVPTGA